MRKGFTIIELVLVVLIISILLGIVSTAAATSIRQARVRKADACCRIMQAGFETYYAQKGRWPGNIDNLSNGPNSDIVDLTVEDVRSMMKEIFDEYHKGNPCMDVSGLYVSRSRGDYGSKDLGFDFWTAVRGTRSDKKGQRMKTSEMYFGYPESNHGYFRAFKVQYSKPTDSVRVMK